jgi:hypothetical protein
MPIYKYLTINENVGLLSTTIVNAVFITKEHYLLSGDVYALSQAKNT